MDENPNSIPYHALFCEILSSALGIRCFCRTFIRFLLLESDDDSPLVKQIVEILDDPSD